MHDNSTPVNIEPTNRGLLLNITWLLGSDSLISEWMNSSLATV